MTETLTKIGYVLDDQVGYLLRLASQRHAALFQETIPDGITPTQFSTLIRLHEQGSCSQNRLGRLAGMDVATIKGVVDRLRDKGLVRTAPDASDKRRSLVSLTPAGQAIIDRLEDAGHEITRKTLLPLTSSEQAILITLLRKLI
jgi:DNA-binding MarR family transcriptional regulator